MLGLKSNSSYYRLVLPKEFLVPEVTKKYYNILKHKKGFFDTPIEFLNETIQAVDVFGVQGAAFEQAQQVLGNGYTFNPYREDADNFAFPSTGYRYRNPQSGLSVVDMTMNIEFRHTLGFLNYFMLFENFWYLYSRDTYSNEMVKQFNIDILNEIGEIYCQIIIQDPIIDSIDMLQLDYRRPIADSSSFKIQIRYSNFEIKYISDIQ